MKTVTFTIEPFTKGLERFRETFEAAQSRRRVTPKEIVGFTSLEAARNFLTRERLGLLRTIKARRPGSLYELASMAGRDLKNVQEDIRILERHGLVRITKRPRGSRSIKVPQVPFQEITLKIAI